MKSILFVVLAGLFLAGCASCPKEKPCCGTCGGGAAVQAECAK
jgi:hypothetical protein